MYKLLRINSDDSLVIGKLSYNDYDLPRLAELVSEIEKRDIKYKQERETCIVLEVEE